MWVIIHVLEIKLPYSHLRRPCVSIRNKGPSCHFTLISIEHGRTTTIRLSPFLRLLLHLLTQQVTGMLFCTVSLPSYIHIFTVVSSYQNNKIIFISCSVPAPGDSVPHPYSDLFIEILSHELEPVET